MSSREVNSPAQQSGDKTLDLLRMFLTLEEWFSEGLTPLASCLALAVLFDTRRQQHETLRPPKRDGSSSAARHDRQLVKPFFVNYQ